MTNTPVNTHFPVYPWGRRGKYNAITDVPGVSVGNTTLRKGNINTGVTAILPHQGNIFRHKLVAASHVINGFGKSVGLPQIDELGQLETPILLTNTLSVPVCTEALIRRAIRENPDIGYTTSTVNPVVGECNDGPLNDIQQMAVHPEHAEAALEAAKEGPMEQGSIGAGTGMSCFGFKGGVGSSSRVVEVKKERFTLGGLVVSNFGKPGNLTLPDGRHAVPPPVKNAEELGSIMTVLATDAPLDSRQLKRVCARVGAGLARLGSFWGNSSGDFVIGLSTVNGIDHDKIAATEACTRFNESLIDPFFEATAELVLEAVLNSMLFSRDFTGFQGRQRKSLNSILS